MLLFLKSLSVQISIVSSRRMLIKSEFMSKLPKTLVESRSTVAVTKEQVFDCVFVGS